MMLRIAGLDDLPLPSARDELVHRVADRLACHVRRSDTLARAQRVARAAGGVAGLGTISRGEAAVLQQLSAAFDELHNES